MGKFQNINDLKVDEDAEANGVELAFANGRFISITRAGSSNKKYKSTMARVFKPHMMTTGVISASDEEASKLLKEVYAESIVVGWRGFKDAEGKEINFTKSNCIELFDDAPEIFEIVQNEASKFSNFARRDEEEAGKK
jgi:hypothetical protein